MRWYIVPVALLAILFLRILSLVPAPEELVWRDDPRPVIRTERPSPPYSAAQHTFTSGGSLICTPPLSCSGSGSSGTVTVYTYMGGSGGTGISVIAPVQ